MAEPFAAPSDVEDLVNVTFDAGETRQCRMVLAAVSAVMRSRLPALDTWIAQGLTDPVLATFCAATKTKDLVDVIEAGNVKSEAHPEHTVTFRDFDESDIDLSDRWLDLLTPSDLRDQSGRAFSIRPGRDDP